MNLLSLALLALALSLDSFTVGLLYGVRRINLSWAAMLVVSLASGLLLWLAMAGGHALAGLLPLGLAKRLGAILLAGVGAWIIYQTWRPRQPEAPAAVAANRRVWRLKLGSVGIVIEILREPGAADLDHSGHISLAEACFLGVALALDSVAAGLGAAMTGYSPYGLPLAAATGSLLLMLVGSRGAHLLPVARSDRWGIVHGLVLMLLGIYRMVF